MPSVGRTDLLTFGVVFLLMSAAFLTLAPVPRANAASYTINLSSFVNSGPSNIGSITFGGATYSLPASPSIANGTYAVTANPPSGYAFVSWSAYGIYVSSYSAPTTSVTVSTQGGNLIAQFEATSSTTTTTTSTSTSNTTSSTTTTSGSYTVNLSSFVNSGPSNIGTITFSGTAYSLPHPVIVAAGTYSVSANPPPGYKFDSWSASGIYVSNYSAQSTSVAISSSGGNLIAQFAATPSCGAPTISFSSVATIGLRVTVNGTATAGSGCTLSYINWYWGDNQLSQGPFPQIHYYASGGVYTIRATAQQSDGQVNTASATITISPITTTTTQTTVTNQTTTRTSGTNITSTTHTTTLNMTTTSTVVSQNFSTNWNPYDDFYSFVNYGLFADGGDCYGFSSTAILYYQHYTLGDQTLPFYPQTTTYMPSLPAQTATTTLTQSTLPIYIHQTYDPNNRAAVQPNLQASVQALEQSIRNGIPVIMSLGPAEFHAVVAWGYTQHPNGSLTIDVSDPNFGAYPMHAYYTNGQFSYQGSYTWSTFAVISPGMVQWGWLLLKGIWASFLESTVTATNPYYVYVFSMVPITIVGQSGQANFSAPSDTQTFRNTISGVVGFEEGNVQVYGIPKGMTFTIKDPGETTSLITIMVPQNQTSVVGYQLRSSSPTGLNTSIEPQASGLSFTAASGADVSVAFFSITPNSHSVLNATSISLAASQKGVFSVPNWGGLNSTEYAPSLQVFQPGSSIPASSYTLTNGTQGTSGQQNGAFPIVLSAAAVAVVIVISVVALYARKRSRSRA